MGEPVRIVDLARRLITLAGRRPDEEIPVVFTGLRPGERLHEEPHSSEESILPTEHQKILMVGGMQMPRPALAAAIGELERIVGERDAEAARRILFEIVAAPRPVAVLSTGS
jgi:O-antigen biosynthesis protein WbqV